MKVNLKDFKLTLSSLGYLVSEITKLITSNPNKAYRISICEWREKRSLSQNALLHMWVGELSKYLISKGRKDASEEFCKDLLKHTFLGFEDKELVNALTGERLVTKSLKHTSKLNVGEMNQFMDRCYYWCVDIGLFLTIPANCEYKELHEQQNK